MNAAQDREFTYWIRESSEYLIRAVTRDTRILELLDVASDYARHGLLAAGNARERVAALGLIQTAEAIRVLHETGVETIRTD